MVTMRFFGTLALSVFFAAAVLAAPAVDKRQQPFVPDQARLNLTDEILFKIKLSNFTARRDAKDPPWADWGSDGCSLAPDTLFKLSFKRACERRDFGVSVLRSSSYIFLCVFFFFLFFCLCFALGKSYHVIPSG